jgi:hypothetical protein
MNDKLFWVNYYCSHPDEGNDDCVTGFDFDTLGEAEVMFVLDNPTYNNGKLIRMEHVAYVELDGPGVNLVRENSSYTPEPESNSWKREIAMQHGMAFGCDGFNEVMGY